MSTDGYNNYNFSDSAEYANRMLDLFFACFDGMQSFNHWRYPICNNVCDFEQESPNLIAAAWFGWDFKELFSLVQSQEWIDFKKKPMWPFVKDSIIKQHIQLYFVRVFELAFVEVIFNLPF